MNTLANPKSASLTDPLASTNIFAHLISLKSRKYNLENIYNDRFIPIHNWYRNAENRMSNESQAITQRQNLLIKIPKPKFPTCM